MGPIQYDWYPYKERKSGHTERRQCEDREKAIVKSRREAGTEPPFMALKGTNPTDLLISELQENKFLLLNHLVCLLRQPSQSNTTRLPPLIAITLFLIFPSETDLPTTCLYSLLPSPHLPFIPEFTPLLLLALPLHALWSPVTSILCFLTDILSPFIYPFSTIWQGCNSFPEMLSSLGFHDKELFTLSHLWPVLHCLLFRCMLLYLAMKC